MRTSETYPRDFLIGHLKQILLLRYVERKKHLGKSVSARRSAFKKERRDIARASGFWLSEREHHFVDLPSKEGFKGTWRKNPRERFTAGCGTAS